MRRALARLLRDGRLLLCLAVVFLGAGCAGKRPAEPAKATPEEVRQGAVIDDITVTEEKGSVVVAVSADQRLTYSSVKHRAPLGVVLYFPRTSLKGVQERYTPHSVLIKEIVASEVGEGEGHCRVQIALKEDVDYNVSQQEKSLLVSFGLPQAEAVAEEEEIESEAEETAPTQVPAPAPGLAQAEEGERPAWVNRLDFVTLEGGRSKVVVGTTAAVRHEAEKESDKKILLKLFNTRIPKFQKRPLITTRFKSAVDRVVPVQTIAMGDTAVIAIELREAVPFKVKEDGNIYEVEFEPSTSVPPGPLPDVKMPEWQQVMKEAEAEVEREVETGTKAVVGERGEVYRGQKISLDFQDADIRHVFRILHDISGKNFVIGEDVKGKVTLKLDNVPWDQVLAMITRMNRLGAVEEGDVVRIAPLTVLEAEEKAIEAKVEAGKTAQKAQEELEPLVTEYISINYSTAADIQAHVNEVKTERGKTSVDTRTNKIIMTDTRSSIEKAKAVVRELDEPTAQVMIEARIVEADANFTRDIGVQWGGSYTRQDTAEPAARIFGGQTYLATGQNYAVNLPPGSITSGLGFTFGRIGSSLFNLDARLLAMETQGKGRTISAPRIMTLDNKAATIKQGTSIPYQKTEEGTTSVEFAEANLELTVTPIITPDNRVNLTIDAKKDAPDWTNAVGGTPAIDTNQATTELLVNDGETVVIGGILKSTDEWTEQRVPLFGDIPVLGWLFKTKLKTKTKNELLIFITPKIFRLEQASQASY